MPPHKKLKTEDSEPEIVNVVTSESESEVATVAAAVDFGVSPDWRDRCVSLSDKYNYALKNSVLADVKLLVGEKATPFSCHRLILALGSPVFEAMFFGELAETGDTVTIPDVHPEGFQHLIRFLYTGQCVLQSADVAFRTYFAADKYCVMDLKHRCESHLCLCNVTPSNVWQFFENSLLLNSYPIKEKCLGVLRHQLKSCLEHDTFMEVGHNTMQALLGLDDLNIGEEKLLRKVVEWADHQAEVVGADSFEDALKPLLSNIRFGALNAREFVYLRHNERLGEVLSRDDSLSILEHIVDPTHRQLPDWCCEKKRRYSPSSASEKEETVNVRSLSSKTTRRRRRPKSPLKPLKEARSSSFSSSSSLTSSGTSSSSSDTSD